MVNQNRLIILTTRVCGEVCQHIVTILVENNFIYLRLRFLHCLVFTANQPLQEDRILQMHRRDLLHLLRNLVFDYESRRRHMGSRLASRGSGSLLQLSPDSLQRVSIHLDLKCKRPQEFLLLFVRQQKTLITLRLFATFLNFTSTNLTVSHAM